jgi:hypothetical protein
MMIPKLWRRPKGEINAYMMIPKLWRRPKGEINAYMISIKERQLLKKIGKTIISSRWNRRRRGISHHSLEMVLKERKLLERPERLSQVRKGKTSTYSMLGF